MKKLNSQLAIIRVAAFVGCATLLVVPGSLGDDSNDEWRRSKPDVVVYVPKGGELNDGDNEHFLVFNAPQSDELLAMWTQSTTEGFGDNHIVLARSKDGRKWSAPEWIVGTHKGTRGTQASWGFPVVTRQGRIYCFYTKSAAGVRGGASGTLGGLVSDDNGTTWTPGPDLSVPSCRESPRGPSSKEVGSFIVWQKPIRDRHDRQLVGFTRWSNITETGSLFFMRFDNADEGPDIPGLEITWLPTSAEGVSLPRYVTPQGCEEPSLVLLPDGRLFCTMRTKTGYIWYTVSDDDGEHWRDPEVLRYRDDGERVKQPLASCPIYPLRDGRYLLLFHNNDFVARHELFGEPLPARHPNIPLSPIFCYRRPAFITVGAFQPEAHQPIWFGRSKQILDTDGIPIGPKRTDEIATYTSFTQYKGRQILWYPDRKYFLLGKYITDGLLEDSKVAP